MNLQVQKKDGSLEPFDRNKISAGLLKSGASAAEAESITVQVESWAQGAAQNGIIHSLEIRNKVLELLRGVNPTAAAAFESYQKPQV
ncbi:MAG: ATP cone domain-containing protein [Patescibacteria group bacterium]